MKADAIRLTVAVGDGIQVLCRRLIARPSLAVARRGLTPGAVGAGDVRSVGAHAYAGLAWAGDGLDGAVIFIVTRPLAV